jgi:hypothetical protein
MLTMNIPDEGYSRTVSSNKVEIYVFIILYCSQNNISAEMIYDLHIWHF